jgi:flavorubredoxin
MRALVVFESMFGNTQRIAEAIRDGLSSRASVEMKEVGAAPTVLDDVQLVVVGGPTQGFGMSRPGTRQGASKQATSGLVSSGIGMREWLGSVQRGRERVAAAAFDTRFKKPSWLTGSAARGAEKQLRELGFQRIALAESFFVTGTTGPLLDGEVERARRWGEELASRFDASEPELRAS